MLTFTSLEFLSVGTKLYDLLKYKLDISVVLNIPCQPESTFFLYNFVCHKRMMSFRTK